MFQTGYKGIQGFSIKLPFEGGFCRWYYTPIQNILSFPAIDPVTQYLSGEPTLKTGATWYEIKVPNDQLGFEETQTVGKGGIFYKQTVSGFHPGDSATSRINLENMPYNEFVIIGKLRAGGLYLVLGDDQNGFSFSQSFKTSAAKFAGNDFVFTHDSLYKGLILTSFLGDNVTPPPDYVSAPGGGTGVGADGNLYEIITFNTETEKTIDWNTTRKTNFGAFPLIQVWSTAGATPVLISVAIDVDAAPPATSLFTVYTPGTPGFIVIK